MQIGDRQRRTFQADCPHCGTKRVAFTEQCVVMWNHNDREFHDVAAKCGQCYRAILVTYTRGSGTSSYRYNGELYPRPLSLDAPKHTPENVTRYYVQGLENLPRNWDAAGSMFRKALETGLKSKFPQKTGTLFDRIESARKARKLTPEMADWAHKIRKLGNSAVHDEIPWTKDEALELRAFTELVFQYLFTLPGMMASAQSAPK